MSNEPSTQSTRRLTVGQVWTSKSGKVRWRVDKIGGRYVTVTNVATGLTLSSFTAQDFLEHMRPDPDHGDQHLQEGSGAPDGPGKVEPWGCIFFTEERNLPVNVDIDEEGRVDVEWVERSDDYWGTQTRRVSFTREEFDQIIGEREYIAAQAARRAREETT